MVIKPHQVYENLVNDCELVRLSLPLLQSEYLYELRIRIRTLETSCTEILADRSLNKSKAVV